MQDALVTRKTEENQCYTDLDESKNSFAEIETICGSAARGTFPLLSSDGSTLLTEKSQILNCWVEHFRNAFNRFSTLSNAAIGRLF
ncbi:hypothetical protein SprV_0602071000 [Sparganum proliferum]